MLRRRTAQGAFAIALLTALSLTACSPDEPRRPEHSATSSDPSITAEPTPTPTVDLRVAPERPPEMDHPSVEGAAAAASYFMRLYGYTWATGDTSLWDALAADTCTFCATVRSNVAEAQAASLTDSGSVVEILEADGTEITAGEWYSADLRIIQGPSTRRDASGALVSQSDGGTFDVAAELSWDGEWSIDAADVFEVTTDATTS